MMSVQFKKIVYLIVWLKKYMHGSRKFFQRVSKFDVCFLGFFFVDKGIKDPNAAMNWPSSARQQNAIEMAFCWRADDSPTLNASLVAL